MDYATPYPVAQSSMKTGFLSPHVPGHFNPMTALARQLQSRNHEVVFITSRLVEPLVRTAGLPFASFGEEESLSALQEKALSGLTQLSKLQGEDASRFALGIVARRVEACGIRFQLSWLRKG